MKPQPLTPRQLEQKLKQLQQQVQKTPQDTKALNQLALVLHVLDRNEEALAACRASLAVDGRQVPILVTAAKLAKKVSLDLAIDYARQAAGLAPDNQDARLTHTHCLMEAYRWSQFIHELKDCEQRWPAAPLVLHMQYFRAIHEERYADAYALTQQHRQLTGKDHLLNYGVIIQEIEGAAAAIRIFQDGIRHHLSKIPKLLPPADSLVTPAEHRYMNVQQARTALVALKTALDDLRIPFFLAFGTLLGIARDGELLPHDKDMDVGLPWATPRLEMIEALLTMGFVCPAIDSYRQQMPEDYATVLHQSTGITIDFFFARPSALDDGGKVVDMGFTKKQDESGREGVTWRFSAFEMGQIDYAGQRFLAPADPAAHMAEIYGPDWRIPDANFDSCIRGHNLTPDSIESGLAMGYNRLLGHLANEKWDKALGYCQQLLSVQADPLLTQLQSRLKKLLATAIPATEKDTAHV